jgi:hypothetical protein
LGLSQIELAAPRRHDPARSVTPGSGRRRATIPLLERISMALDADLIVEIAPHAD